MPYIKRCSRMDLDPFIQNLTALINAEAEEDRDGMLNYIVTMLLRKVYTPPKYYRYQKAIGLCESVKLEFYRRMVAEYEDEKIKENGDL